MVELHTCCLVYLYSFRDETGNMAGSAKVDEVLHIFCVLLSVGSENSTIWVRVQGMMDSTLRAQVKGKATEATIKLL